MTPDEVVNIIEVLTEIKVYGLKENEHYLDRYNALNSAISFIQDYQKLRERVSVEKIEDVILSHNVSIEPRTPTTLAKAILKYLTEEQPNG